VCGREVALGCPPRSGAWHLHARMETTTCTCLITANHINSQVGGNLSTMLRRSPTHISKCRAYLDWFSEHRALDRHAAYSGYYRVPSPFLPLSPLAGGLRYFAYLSLEPRQGKRPQTCSQPGQPPACSPPGRQTTRISK